LRSSTVDVANAPVKPAEPPSGACGVDDAATLDFGSGFDCFDKTSETAHTPLPQGVQANRQKIVETMKTAGFRNDSREWWHFTLRKKPHPKQFFDFPVTAGE
jgi:D-alanyl-D-alanine dipeptidase